MCMFMYASVCFLNYKFLSNDFRPKQLTKNAIYLYTYLKKMKTSPIYTSHFLPKIDEQRSCIFLLRGRCVVDFLSCRTLKSNAPLA